MRRGCPADVEGAKCYMLQLLQMLQSLSQITSLMLAKLPFFG